MTTQLATSPTIRRHADESIDYGFYRAEAQRLRIEQHRAAWQWLSDAVRKAVSCCRHALSLDREIDIVTRLR
jgi:hypothetical protein